MKVRRMLCSLCLLFFAVRDCRLRTERINRSNLGQVVDPQNAVVANAKVTATNKATGVGRSVTTTSTGNYVIPNLPPGTYA